MKDMQFTVDIRAPKEQVWEIMLADETYREWTDAFHEGSYYDGSWEEGSDIRFLAEDEGKLSGMAGKIAKNIPYEYLSIQHLGEIIDGEIDTTSERGQQWQGAFENYRFSETDGVTTVAVELKGPGVSDEIGEMFADMWPPALEKLKEIVESRA